MKDYSCKIDGYYTSLRALELAMDEFIWRTEDGGICTDMDIRLRRVENYWQITISEPIPA